MDEKQNKEYLERLTEVLSTCLTTPPSTKHAFLIVAHDETESLSMYSVNATEEMLPAMVRAAQLLLTSDSSEPRVIH